MMVVVWAATEVLIRCRLPPIIFLIIRKPSAKSIHFYASWFCIVFGTYFICPV